MTTGMTGTEDEISTTHTPSNAQQRRQNQTTNFSSSSPSITITNSDGTRLVIPIPPAPVVMNTINTTATTDGGGNSNVTTTFDDRSTVTTSGTINNVAVNDDRTDYGSPHGQTAMVEPVPTTSMMQQQQQQHIHFMTPHGIVVQNLQLQPQPQQSQQSESQSQSESQPQPQPQQRNHHVRISYHNVNQTTNNDAVSSATAFGTENLTNNSTTSVGPVPPLEPQPVTRLTGRTSSASSSTHATTTTDNNTSSDGRFTGAITGAAAAADEQSSRNSHDDHHDRWDQFKCGICYEFMTEPAGCGSCSSRFCRLCLERCRRNDLNIIRRQQIITTSTQPASLRRQQQEQEQEQPKCPICRQPYESVVRDMELQQEMLESGPELPCRFDGCVEVLRLPSIAVHERTCSHAPVHCRFAPYGCTWTGKRGDVSGHENSGNCHLSNISTFLQEYRKTKADHQFRIQVVAQRAALAVRSSAATQQNLVVHQQKSVYDVFSVLYFAYLVTSSTPFVRRTLNTWMSFLSPMERVGSVANMLCFLPLLVISLSVFSRGIFCFLELAEWLERNNMLKVISSNNESDTRSTETFWNTERAILVADCVLGFCAGMLGSMLVIINFLDAKSSLRWQSFDVKHIGKHPIVGDLFAIACFTQVLIVLEYFHGGMKALLLWLCLSSSTIVFPTTVWTTSNLLVNRPLGTNWKPRCFPQIKFGLLSGLLATLFDIGPCLDSIVIYTLLFRNGPLTVPSMLMSGSPSCFLNNLPKPFCLAYVGLRLSSLMAFYVSPVVSKEDRSSGNDSATVLWYSILVTLVEGLIPSVVCTLGVLTINFLFNSFEKFATWMSEKIMKKTSNIAAHQSSLRPDQQHLVQADFTAEGMFIFSFWALTMVVIAHF